MFPTLGRTRSPRDLVTLSEAASALGLSAWATAYLVRVGELPKAERGPDGHSLYRRTDVGKVRSRAQDAC